jgi:PTS system glucose-specific IIB component
MVTMKNFKHLFTQALGGVQNDEPSVSGNHDLHELILAFGGRGNIIGFDACLTRLRVNVHSVALVNSEALQQAGAIGVVTVGHEVQAIFGKRSDNLRSDLEKWFGLKVE